jgi:hypothetical protein
LSPLTVKHGVKAVHFTVDGEAEFALVLFGNADLSCDEQNKFSEAWNTAELHSSSISATLNISQYSPAGLVLQVFAFPPAILDFTLNRNWNILQLETLCLPAVIF